MLWGTGAIPRVMPTVRQECQAGFEVEEFRPLTYTNIKLSITNFYEVTWVPFANYLTSATSKFSHHYKRRLAELRRRVRIVLVCVTTVHSSLRTNSSHDS